MIRVLLWFEDSERFTSKQSSRENGWHLKIEYKLTK
jgi:hypothetical protein